MKFQPIPDVWAKPLAAILLFSILGAHHATQGAGTDQALVDAAAAGDPQAQFRLGLAHLQVISEERKIEDGVQYILTAAKSGYAPARTFLAEFYLRGTVVPYEPETAFQLLLESALDQHHAAAYGVAQCYRHGIGVERNATKAETWFARAGNLQSIEEGQLDSESLRTVGLCLRDGRGVTRSYPEAVRWLVKSAQTGNPRALFELANFYAFGLGVAKNDHKAFALYTRAAYAGSGQACLAVSRRYRDGKGVAADPAEANLWAQRAINHFEAEAELGNLDAATDLYLYLSRGVVDEDPGRAQKWLDIAVAQGYPRALTLSGEALATGNGVEKNVELAVTRLKAAAAANESGAHYLLFQLYLRGEGVAQDSARALQHLRSAAECGNVTAMSRLADWYLAHPEAEQADAQSTSWQRRAYEENLRLAERDQVQAQLALVTIHGRGHGVPKDDAQALYWLQRAAESGYDEAQYMIANAYENGLGVDPDPEQAVQWYREAGDQGYVPAMLSMATILERGDLGVAKDQAAAQDWYDRAIEITEEAALEGDPDAAYMMSTYYREGLGREPSPSQVLHWMHRAAELGDPKACVRLSQVYSEGRDVLRDPDEAYRFLSKAVELGDPEARYLLGRLYDEGGYLDRDYARAYELYYLAAKAGITPARHLVEEMEVTLNASVVQRARAKAEQVLREERLQAGDLTGLR